MDKMNEVILATAGYDHKIHFWEPPSGECRSTLRFSDSQVCCGYTCACIWLPICCCSCLLLCLGLTVCGKVIPVFMALECTSCCSRRLGKPPVTLICRPRWKIFDTPNTPLGSQVCAPVPSANAVNSLLLKI